MDGRLFSNPFVLFSGHFWCRTATKGANLFFAVQFPVRYIPSWIPGARFKRQGEAWRVRLQDLSEVPHQWVKGQMVGAATCAHTYRHVPI